MQTLNSATLFKRESSTGVFLWILRHFYKHLFSRTSENGCSCGNLVKVPKYLSCRSQQLLPNLRRIDNPLFTKSHQKECKKSEDSSSLKTAMLNIIVAKVWFWKLYLTTFLKKDSQTHLLFILFQSLNRAHFNPIYSSPANVSTMFQRYLLVNTTPKKKSLQIE